MFANVPTLAVAGVPLSRPVVVLKAAQLGRFAIANVSVPPSGSLAVGVNAYATPTVAVVAGVPEIVGGRFAGALTVIVNAGSAALAEPSLTLMPMFANVPMLAVVGVPLIRPVDVLNVAQLGRFEIANVSVPPSGSLAVGVNEYAAPTGADAGGVPEIVGGRFGAALTVIVKAGNEALAAPSLTLIEMLANVPTFALVGVPLSRPVVVLNVAQLGRFAIANVSVPPSGSLAVGVKEYATATGAVAGGVPEIVGARFEGTIPPPLIALTAAMSLAAPAAICVSAGSSAAAAPLGSAWATAAGSMPGVNVLKLCCNAVSAGDGTIAIAAAVPVRAASIMPAVIGSDAVGAATTREASRLIAPSSAAVAGWPLTRRLFVIDSTTTCELASAAVADACASVEAVPRPSSLPSVRSAPMTRTTSSTDELRPDARLIECTRRRISASVSELFTISGRFESLIVASMTPPAASVVSPLLNLAVVVASAVRTLADVGPPPIWPAAASASVVNGFRFAVARLPAASAALRSAKSGGRFVTRSVPSVASMNKGKCLPFVFSVTLYPASWSPMTFCN